jgi:hypothetical protein
VQHSKVKSKWPEQHPAPGENPFEFVLRMAMQRRRSQEDTSELARIKRTNELRRNTRFWD